MKYVYSFNEGNTKMKDILGGKGANLAEMTRLKIPVPSGFTITTDVCRIFSEKGVYPASVDGDIKKFIKKMEKQMKMKFGYKKNPMLVSVRSGAAVSMPGMMDTVLNLGLNDETVLGLAEKTGNLRFAYDAYRRFIQMFGNVVMEVQSKYFEQEIQKIKNTKGVNLDTELEAEDLKNVIWKFKNIVKKHAGKIFPFDPYVQLEMAIKAVFKSWNIPRAVSYRKIHNITGLKGTAVNVQAMVFGNMGETSGTGVAFTRNPSTGEKKFYGEYLINAQGEDVVAGIRTPEPISTLKKKMPRVYAELEKIYKKLEKHERDMLDIEFTIQEGKLYMLQYRVGKRTAHAAIKIAVEMKKEKLITEKEAVLRIDPETLNQLLHKQIDLIAKNEANVIGRGLPASPGAAVGKIVFTADRAVGAAEEGNDVILVRTETSPEDIEGMDAAKGILTSRGGMTSHAAVVARGMGKCCVAGCDAVKVYEEKKYFEAGKKVFKEGDYITLDGGTGEVIEGKIPVKDPELSGDFNTLMKWADKYRRLYVKTNADTPQDIKKAISFGAEGVGLCRTEHMFFEGERIQAVREMILAETKEERKNALRKIAPMQKKDFKDIFEVLGGKPIIVRLLDPPLHEFLPKEKNQIQEVAKQMGVDPKRIEEKIKDLFEFNPMLGFRGCRLGIAYPEINEMQIRAILEAAKECRNKGIKVKPQIEIPLAGSVKEFMIGKKIADYISEEIGYSDYQIGSMIEVPRAALTADEFACECDFISFGTNDLTQMGCGFSRDDAGKFLGKYVEQGIYERDPFQSIDQEGVGKLMKICVDSARKANKKIEIGICGEHGGDPASVEFCHRLGLDDVSCSPFRVPIARLAAAQAAIKTN